MVLVGGAGVLAIAREVQIPLLGTLLIGASAAKVHQLIATRSTGAAAGPSAMFPLRLHRPVAIALCATEWVLGLTLLLTAGNFLAGSAALAVRSAVVLLFFVAVGALQELRTRRPEAGCGCFGDLSEAPVSWRTMTRTALLALAAIATIGVPPLRLPASSGQAALMVGLITAELAVFAALSPEVGEIMVRLGHAEPCEVRRVPVGRTLAVLRGSPHWRRYRGYLLDTTPIDVWREGCWRFVSFPAVLASHHVEVVFAVHLGGRAAVRAGVLDVEPATVPPRHSRAGDPLQLSN